METNLFSDRLAARPGCEATTIECYISPNDLLIPNYAELDSSDPNISPQDLGSFYKWRILSTREFTP
jgi:hypothetical protein